MYQRSDVPGLTAAGPTGFFVLAQGAGNPIPAIKYLPTSLLNGTHTYSVTLGTDAVTFGVDGNTVAKFTGRAYVPAGTAGPVVSQIWIDSNFYTYTFLPIGQVTDVPATAHIEWFKEGPPSFVNGPNPITPPRSSRCRSARSNLANANKALAAARRRYQLKHTKANRTR